MQLTPDVFDGSNSSNSSAHHGHGLTTATDRPPNRRKAHARLAARERRSYEASTFQEIRSCLPVASKEVLRSLDRLAVLRVAACYVKLRHVVTGDLSIMPTPKNPPISDSDFLDSNANALLGDDGFLLIMNTDADIIYVSDNVSNSLNCDKLMLLGTNLHDHVHNSYGYDVRQLVRRDPHARTHARLHSVSDTRTELVYLRNGNPLRITGKLFGGAEGSHFIGVGVKVDHPFDNTFPLENANVVMEFDFVLTADFRFARPHAFLGYNSNDLLGRSAFDMIHSADLRSVRGGLRKMLTRGAYQTPGCFRLMVNGGGYAWFKSRLAMVSVERTNEFGAVEHVKFCVGRHFMVSEVQDRDLVLAPIQTNQRPTCVVHHYGIDHENALYPPSPLSPCSSSGGPSSEPDSSTESSTYSKLSECCPGKCSMTYPELDMEDMDQILKLIDSDNELASLMETISEYEYDSEIAMSICVPTCEESHPGNVGIEVIQPSNL